MKKLKLMLASLVAVFGLAAPLALAPAASAQVDIPGSLCEGGNLEIGADCEDDAVTDESINGLIADVINLISLVVGVIAVIMIIIGGVKYITSGGDSGNVTGAKNTILYAVIGLIIVALSQLIVNFVLNTASSV